MQVARISHRANLEGKYTKDEVGYEHPARGKDHCGECRHYAANRCKIVLGRIEPGDWCKKFQIKANK